MLVSRQQARVAGMTVPPYVLPPRAKCRCRLERSPGAVFAGINRPMRDKAEPDARLMTGRNRAMPAPERDGALAKILAGRRIGGGDLREASYGTAHIAESSVSDN
jgi:hypothetical protein